jgi:hypothetical protein
MWPIPKFGKSEEEKRDHVGGRIRRIAFPISDQSQPAFAESSLSDRLAFANGVFETGLPRRSAEKRAPKQAHEIERDVFSSPVPPQNLQNCADSSRLPEKYDEVSLRRRLCGGAGWIRTLDTGLNR